MVFFFSSRRRHTRWPRDWSSDVCSSDLSGGIGGAAADIELQGDDLREVRDSVLTRIAEATGQTYEQVFADSLRDKWFAADARSEERRVGKECRSGEAKAHEGRRVEQERV